MCSPALLASYPPDPLRLPLQVTDRYAQSMSPSELVRWNDRVARLEAEITAEKERRWAGGLGQWHSVTSYDKGRGRAPEHGRV